MNLRRVLGLWRKDLALGPRSPILLFAVVMPVLITLLVQGVFGNLFERPPRLGIVDTGDSAVTAAALELDDLRTSRVVDVETLQRLVTDHDLDAGLVLTAGFDAALRAGERPPLTLYVAGESRANDRVLVAIATIDLLRGVEGRAPNVSVEVVAPGGDGVPLQERLVPFIVLYALFAAGVFVTSFSFTEEREKRTLDALLASPLTMADVLWAKGLFGGTLAAAMALVTMALNGALLGQPLGLLVALALGAVMSALIGLLYGIAAPDTKVLFALVKTLSILVFAPALWYVFPEWPAWIAYLFPTYWLLDPIVQIGQQGASLADVAWKLAIGLAICVALVPIVRRLAERVTAPAAVA
ncbi:MAG: ABC transporter permease [Trueperaceae bacterium]|nr:ABC transporter permease [Trueperaceae bacterium]